MINGLIGIKKGMTEFFTDSGEVVPTTVIVAGPCYVIDKKTIQRDGYNSLKIGFKEVKPQRSNKAIAGVFKKTGVPPLKIIKEFKVNNGNYDEYKIGDIIGVDVFNEGDSVDVTSSSKGKGFSGVMKRYGFAGQPDSHGGMAHRRPGSIGQHSYPGRVWKGLKMPGHYGSVKVTLQGLKILKTDKENNCLLVKGSVPGPNNSYVIVKHTTKGK
jgi:large subunit ribosomal protein L3